MPEENQLPQQRVLADPPSMIQKVLSCSERALFLDWHRRSFFDIYFSSTLWFMVVELGFFLFGFPGRLATTILSIMLPVFLGVLTVDLTKFRTLPDKAPPVNFPDYIQASDIQSHLDDFELDFQRKLNNQTKKLVLACCFMGSPCFFDWPSIVFPLLRPLFTRFGDWLAYYFVMLSIGALLGRRTPNAFQLKAVQHLYGQKNYLDKHVCLKTLDRLKAKLASKHCFKGDDLSWEYSANRTTNASILYLQGGDQASDPKLLRQTIKGLSAAFLIHGINVVYYDDKNLVIQAGDLDEKKIDDVFSLYQERSRLFESYARNKVSFEESLNDFMQVQFSGLKYELLVELREKLGASSPDQCLPVRHAQIRIPKEKIEDRAVFETRAKLLLGRFKQMANLSRMSFIDEDDHYVLDLGELTPRQHVPEALIKKTLAVSDAHQPGVLSSDLSTSAPAFHSKQRVRKKSLHGSNRSQEEVKTVVRPARVVPNLAKLAWPAQWPDRRDCELFEARPPSLPSDKSAFILWNIPQMMEILGEHYEKFKGIAQRSVFRSVGAEGIAHVKGRYLPNTENPVPLPYKLRAPDSEVRVYLKQEQHGGVLYYIPAYVELCSHHANKHAQVLGTASAARIVSAPMR